MNRRVFGVLGTVMGIALAMNTSTRANGADRYDAAVQKLLSQMSVEEKVGQMTQISLEVVSKQRGDNDRFATIDPQKLREAILKYHVGSILNCGGAANTVDNWHEVLTAIQDVATKESRLKVPVIYGIDSIHGANYVVGATLFPQSVAMGASGNVDLVAKASAITAMETRAAGIPWNFNPVLCMGRQPLWSRFWETYGEDAYLASVMGDAYVRAQQGDDPAGPTRVAACMKHYLGYSYPRTGKDRTPAWIPERELRERFLPPFAAAAKAGVLTCMVCSSEINGIPVHSSREYLTDWLKEIGFQGFVVSDWEDIKNLYTREKVVASQREAVKMAVMAGIDMSMVPNDYSFYDHLVDLVKKNEVPVSRIDEAVARILKVKFQAGLFRKPYPDKSLKRNLATPESTAVNLEAARECITLLENKSNVLPLKKDSKILVTGPTANLLKVLNGGWTITWQGDREDLYPKEKQTVLKAIQAKIGKKNVSYVPGTDFDKPIDIEAAARAAKKADAVVLCIGEPTYCETPGNIDDLTLPEAQLELVRKVAAANKPVVLVLLEGRPRIIRPVVDKASAIIMGYLPGMEGGTAIADVLFGDVNPSGKLPFTYPKQTGDLTWYDHKNSEKYDPEWPFGHGLSYTKFAYADLTLAKKAIGPGDSLEVTVAVKNAGKRAGKEIVQLYLQDEVASVTPAVRRLKRFTKIALEPGESKTVRFTLEPADYQFIGRANKPVIEPGAFRVMIGGLQQEFEIK